MPLLLGCIADDFTGATDLAGTLVKSGLRTIQLNGLPPAELPLPEEAEAIVVALKSRTQPVGEAVANSLAAQAWLSKGGAQQIFFKYCSTFDSTDEGNIGPVAEALMQSLDAEITIACPGFAATGRTIYQGHLFVWDQLLSESSMKDHPLTPMTDANLVRVLGRQTSRKVGLVPLPVVMAGEEAVRDKLEELKAEGVSLAICDMVNDAHLVTLGHAMAGRVLVTGGSGVAMGLADNFRDLGFELPDPTASMPRIEGAQAVLSGSCSQATLGQVAHVEDLYPTFRLDPVRLSEGENQAKAALAWAADKLGETPVLIVASDSPEAVRAVQERLGRREAGELIERTMSAIAQGLVERGVRRLVVAGGETSGAVVSALKVTGLRIGPEIAPGVPATVSLTDPPLALALKSGNFGGPDFFVKAFEVMP
jgi:uncharacterized protein YgbK (DUF1537 family)